MLGLVEQEQGAFAEQRRPDPPVRGAGLKQIRVAVNTSSTSFGSETNTKVVLPSNWSVQTSP